MRAVWFTRGAVVLCLAYAAAGYSWLTADAEIRLGGGTRQGIDWGQGIVWLVITVGMMVLLAVGRLGWGAVAACLLALPLGAAVYADGSGMVDGTRMDVWEIAVHVIGAVCIPLVVIVGLWLSERERRAEGTIGG